MIIDEAQHLQPEVLEQLRLLTNLETNTKKLLQVILIGQPELQQLLQRRDLRQLAQRITARYHLLPLNKQEVDQYLKHRLSVAKCFRRIFDKSAVNAIHKTCKGIPRLMNLLAERALMNAYNSNNAVVNRKIVLQAAYDALGDEYQVVAWWQSTWLKSGSLIVLLSLVLFAGIWWGTTQTPDAPSLTSTASNNEQSVDQLSKIEMLQAELDKQRALLPPAIEKTNDDLENTFVDDDMANEAVTLTNKSSATPKKQTITDSEVINNDGAEKLNQTSAGTDFIAKTNVNDFDDINAIEQVNEPVEKKDFVVEAMDGVSDELLASFQSAIEETKPPITSQNRNQMDENTDSSVSSLTQMPAWVQDGVPSIQFEMHIYASDGQGWVRVNGRDRYEGDYIGRELLLSEIRPQEVVLSFRGEKFTMAALSSWN